VNALLLVAGGATVLGLLGGYVSLYAVAPRDIDVVREVLTEDADFLPWLLRLSIGLPLVGAGFTGYFISPAVPVPATPLVATGTRLFLVGLGLFLLYGVGTRVVAAAGLLAYVTGLLFVARPLLLASEYLGGFLAVILVGSGRPSLDRLLYRVESADGTLYGPFGPMHGLTERLDRRLGQYEAYTPTALRVGLGVNFVYTGLSDKLLQPNQALAVVEQYRLTAVVPVDPGLWVVGAGSVELLLGVGLIVGLFTRGVAAVALGMFTLTLFAIPDDPVLAHISLFGMTTALLITGSGRLGLDNL
jgi:uncharacterized membrane protein YphA (DoxX/SURF4 family)